MEQNAKNLFDRLENERKLKHNPSVIKPGVFVGHIDLSNVIKGDKILFTDQSNAKDNGIYTVTSSNNFERIS